MRARKKSCCSPGAEFRSANWGHSRVTVDGRTVLLADQVQIQVMDFGAEIGRVSLYSTFVSLESRKWAMQGGSREA